MMGDFFIKFINTLRKPGAIGAAFAALLFYLIIQFTPPIKTAVENFQSAAVISCSDTITITESIVWYHSPQSLEAVRSFLLQYYPPLVNGLSRDDTEAILAAIWLAYTEGYRNKLNGLTLCFPEVGTWYSDRFSFERFSNDVINIILNDQEYTTVQDREILVNKLVNLIEATLRSYQNQTTLLLRQKLQDMNK